MPMPNLLRVAVAAASSNGRFEGRWPSGDKPGSAAALDGGASVDAATSAGITTQIRAAGDAAAAAVAAAPLTTQVKLASDAAAASSASGAMTTTAPAKPASFTWSDNGNGTFDASWTFGIGGGAPTALVIQIWNDTSAAWVTLVDLSGNLAATSLTNQSIPAATGATRNGLGEFGLRLYLSNSFGAASSDDLWVVVAATMDAAAAAQATAIADLTTGGNGSSTNTAQILKYVSYTGGTNGANVSGANFSAYGTCKYSNAVVEGSDTTSMALSINAGQTAHGFAYMDPVNEAACPKKGDTLWVSVRMFRPTGYSNQSSGAGSHLKFFRIRTYNTGGGNGANSPGYDDVYLASSGSSSGGSSGSWQSFYEGTSIWNQITGPGNEPVNNVWETYDWEVVFDNVAQASGGQGRIRFWRNKILLGEVSRTTLTNATAFGQEVHYSTYWNGGAPQTQTMYINKVAIAIKKAGGRDDSSYLTTDSSGRPLIAVGL